MRAALTWAGECTIAIALTRAVGPAIANCALTYLPRVPINFALAARQHDAYEGVLRDLGLAILRLVPQPDLPDAVFVEDTAVVVDEVAVMTAPRLSSRRREVESVARALAPLRPIHTIEGEGTLEGGDVVRHGRTLYVGLSTRTNQEGINQLGAILEPLGYTVRAVSLGDCLHLKTACTLVAPDTLLANPDWIDTAQMPGLEVIPVAPDEPEAANALLVDGTVVMPESFPATVQRLHDRGVRVRTVDVSELQKAEAGVTCCSIVVA